MPDRAEVVGDLGHHAIYAARLAVAGLTIARTWEPYFINYPPSHDRHSRAGRRLSQEGVFGFLPTDSDES
jgi:hypothetical protein